jgi:hypothetical protein
MRSKLYLLRLTTSMPLATAALHMEEPTNPLPPKTTICKSIVNYFRKPGLTREKSSA